MTRKSFLGRQIHLRAEIRVRICHVGWSTADVPGSLGLTFMSWLRKIPCHPDKGRVSFKKISHFAIRMEMQIA